MPDITCCTNRECPLRVSCYRYLARWNRWQSLSKFKGGETCDAYWEVGQEDNLLSLTVADARATEQQEAP